MDFSGVKLVVSDMDGTLLNDQHEVSDLFFEQFEQLKFLGVRFVAASGRQYHSILGKLKSIESDLMIVAENGAYVVENGKDVYVNAFSKLDVYELVKELNNIHQAQIVLAGKKQAYFLKTTQDLELLIAEYYCEYKVVSSFKELPKDEILKIAVYHPLGSELHILPEVKHLKNKWQIKVSGENWLDIALPNNHKGNAVATIQHQMGITPEQTMAFGDYQNDVEMLQKAHFSFAMENAHPDVKKIANFRTTTNQERGVENILAQVLQCKGK